MPTPHLERFEALVLPYLDDAYTLACYLLRNEQDAQDVVQDASLRAFRYFDGYRGGDVRAWFLAIVRNCCFTWQRKQKADASIAALTPDIVFAVPEPEPADATAIAHSERDAINRAMAELPLEFREVIVLREIQGMSYAEIGSVTGVPAGTVMSRLSRARRKLASLLGNSREAL